MITRLTTPDNSTLNGDEAFEEAWKVMEMLKHDLANNYHSATHMVLSHRAWIEAVSRMKQAKDRLAEHHRRFNS